MANNRGHMPGSKPGDTVYGRARSLVACFLVAQTIVAIAPLAYAIDPVAGRFDYYALSLSWSPTYCRSPAGHEDRQQCGVSRGYAFVVHGLWPQYSQGWPQNCAPAEKWVPDRIIASMLDIMPSKNLVIHEWRRHGGCSGLKMQRYFDLTRAFFGKLNIPARYLSPLEAVTTTPGQIVSDFLKSNRRLTADMLSVQCGNSRGAARLSELRVCFTKDGEFRSCGANEKRQCNAQTLVLPPVRGGSR
jgi:ribonuclease T2